MIRLVFTDPAFAKQCCELPDGAFTVGRSANNSLRIEEDSVSGHHCKLLVNGSELIVRESGSRNGTYVNKVRVLEQSGVRNGQIIKFGRVDAEVQIERPLEFEVDELSTVQGLLQRSVAEGEVKRSWVVAPMSASTHNKRATAD